MHVNHEPIGRRVSRMILAAAAVAACRGAAPAPPSVDANAPARPAATVDGQPDAAGTTATDAAPAVASAAASAAPPATCRADADCGWDDPCAPTACAAATKPPPGMRCGRPSTPGACKCVGGACALVRSPATRDPSDAPRCAASADCAFDAAAGRCVEARAGATPSRSGIVCACDVPNQRCVQSWAGDVPCRTFADCSFVHVGGAGDVVAPSWFAPRRTPAPARPCKDGPADAVCKEGTCRLVRWKC